MHSTLHVAGMHAVHAARAVYTALSAVEGITAVDVRLGVIAVEHDGRATLEVLRSAITHAGFEVTEAHESPRHLPFSPLPPAP